MSCFHYYKKKYSDSILSLLKGERSRDASLNTGGGRGAASNRVRQTTTRADPSTHRRETSQRETGLLHTELQRFNQSLCCQLHCIECLFLPPQCFFLPASLFHTSPGSLHFYVPWVSFMVLITAIDRLKLLNKV